MTAAEKRQLALAKLTPEEQELLGLKVKSKNYHTLKIYYMIGDADGDTSEKANISLDNPFLEHLTGSLDKLETIPGHWGIMMDDKHLEGNLKKGTINQFECDLLSLIANYCDEDSANEFLAKYNYEVSESHYEYLSEFEGLLRSEAPYSFLVYQGYKLK
jgi:hypothetical protein